MIPPVPFPGPAPLIPIRAALETALHDMDRTLAAAVETVRAGGMVDLSGLDRESLALLEAVPLLGPADAKALLPLLDRLLAGLDGLEAALRQVHGGTLGGSDRVSRTLRAVNAYRPPEGS